MANSPKRGRKTRASIKEPSAHETPAIAASPGFESLLRHLAALPPSPCYVHPDSPETWETYFCPRTVPVGVQSEFTADEQPGVKSVPFLGSVPVTNSDVILNASAPVWALDFSPPTITYRHNTDSANFETVRIKTELPATTLEAGQTTSQRNRTRKGRASTKQSASRTPVDLDSSQAILQNVDAELIEPIQSAFAVLAVGVAPWSRPLTRTNSNESGPGLIQLWKIPLIGTETPEFALGILHKGEFCRCVKWLPHSAHKGIGTAGLLFCVVGDGSLSCYNVLQDVFQESATPQLVSDLMPLWHCAASPQTKYCSIALSTRLDNTLEQQDQASILIAAGTSIGEIHIFRWSENFSAHQASVPQTISMPGILAPVVSLSWSPVDKSSLLASASLDGKLKVIDTLALGNNEIFGMETTKRPSRHVHWAADSKFILACHVTGVILNTQTRECSHRIPMGTAAHNAAFNKGAASGTPWDCTSLLNLGIFSFDNGCILVLPMNRLDRRRAPVSAVVEWITQTDEAFAAKTEPPIVDEDPPMPAQSVEPCKEVPDAILKAETLQKIYKQAAEFYISGARTAREKGVLLQIKKERIHPASKEKSRGVGDVLAHERMQCKLHAVSAVDPYLYPVVTAPLAAAGGAPGLIHLFKPLEWNLI